MLGFWLMAQTHPIGIERRLLAAPMQAVTTTTVDAKQKSMMMITRMLMGIGVSFTETGLIGGFDQVESARSDLTGVDHNCTLHDAVMFVT